MTTLIVKQTDKDVILGWDSLMAAGNESSSLVQPKFCVNNGVIIGVAGMLRASQVMEFFESPDYDGTDPRKWLISKWVPAARAHLADDPTVMEEGECIGWSMIVVVGGQAFGVDQLLTPFQSGDGLYTLGSGGDFARGAYYAGADVLEALNVAAMIDPYTGGALTVCRASKYLESFV